MMPKATSIYVVILAIFGGGLWAILSIGNIFLRAPTDVSGTWQLWASADAQTPAHAMNFEQSGRFVRMEFDHHTYDLKMTRDRQSTPLAVEFRGAKDLSISFDQSTEPHAEYMMIHLSGPIQGSFLGTRDDARFAAPSTQALSNDAQH